MWLVKYALKFRNSFYVLAILILLAGVGASVVMPKDVLPEVNIPVVTVVWPYTGLDPPEMESRVTPYAETMSAASATWRAPLSRASLFSEFTSSRM